MGYALEDFPEPRRYDLTIKNSAMGVYAVSTNVESGAIVYRSGLITSSALLKVEDYLSIKRFYDSIAATERTRLVFWKPKPE